MLKRHIASNNPPNLWEIFIRKNKVIWICGYKASRSDITYCSTTTMSFASALKPTLEWLPSQYGLLLDAPHLHIAANTFPSTTTNSGPFSLHFISTLAMIH